jgi:hypothetical protein
MTDQTQVHGWWTQGTSVSRLCIVLSFGALSMGTVACGDGGRAAMIACQERLVGFVSVSEPVSLDGCSDAQRHQHAALLREMSAIPPAVSLRTGDLRDARDVVARIEHLQDRRAVLRQDLERMRRGEQ